MLRALLLSLLILCTVAATLPLADSLAKGPRAAAAQRHHRHRRHTRAWWRRHRRMMRRRRAAVVARRARLQAQTPATQPRPVPVAVTRANPVANQRFAETSAVPGTQINIAGQRNINNGFIIDGLSANDDAAGL